jgi:hypothetical protein
MAGQHNEPVSNDDTEKKLDHDLMTAGDQKNKGLSRFPFLYFVPFYFIDTSLALTNGDA